MKSHHQRVSPKQFPSVSNNYTHMYTHADISTCRNSIRVRITYIFVNFSCFYSLSSLDARISRLGAADVAQHRVAEAAEYHKEHH